MSTEPSLREYTDKWNSEAIALVERLVEINIVQKGLSDPIRKGVPKGAEIGPPIKKIRAAWLMTLNPIALSLRDLAKRVKTSPGTLYVWRTEKGFRVLRKKARLFIVDYLKAMMGEVINRELGILASPSHIGNRPSVEPWRTDGLPDIDGMAHLLACFEDEVKIAAVKKAVDECLATDQYNDPEQMVKKGFVLTLQSHFLLSIQKAEHLRMGMFLREGKSLPEIVELDMGIINKFIDFLADPATPPDIRVKIAGNLKTIIGRKIGALGK